MPNWTTLFPGGSTRISGTPGTIPKFNSDGNGLENSAITEDSDSVDIDGLELRTVDGLHVTGNIDLNIDSVIQPVNPTGTTITTTSTQTSGRGSAGTNNLNVSDTSNFSEGDIIVFPSFTGIRPKVITEIFTSFIRLASNLEETITSGTNVNRLSKVAISENATSLVQIPDNNLNETLTVTFSGDITDEISVNDYLFNSFNNHRTLGTATVRRVEVNSDGNTEVDFNDYDGVLPDSSLTRNTYEVVNTTGTTTLAAYQACLFQRDGSLIDARDFQFTNLPTEEPDLPNRLYSRTGSQLGLTGAAASEKFILIS